jgi:type I restriction-modification system DNA methylase subunit
VIELMTHLVFDPVKQQLPPGITIYDPACGSGGMLTQSQNFNVETVDATPRSSDGQRLFLMEMVSKMKTPLNGAGGSRVASVHNGSSLFTGDAGSGESNIRRYVIENDLLEAIIQLPNNLELYKSLANDAAFKAAMQQSLRRLVDA